MENLNAEQVKKALECCTNNDECVGEECPYYATGCENNMPKDALALVNSQEQRIGELAEENERLIGAVKQYEEERKYHFGMSRTRIAEAKADTVQKILHLVKQRAESCETIIASSIRPIDTIYQISNTELDQIAKEMLEGDNEN